MTHIIQSIDTVADQYDAFFCDVWGVLHNGRAAYADASRALQRMRAAGKTVILVTNVPKPRETIPPQLDRAGVPRDAWDAIVTSGDAIRAALAERAPGPMYRIGPYDYDRALWEGLGLREAPLDQATFVAISGLNRDDETPADYAEILQQARARDLDLLCANPDIIVQWGDRMIWCAGAIARDYAALGGRVIMAGKPYAPIYELASRELDAIRAVKRERILCIGDGIPTDIAGANAQDLDCLFVASGMHGEALWTEGEVDTDKVDLALSAESVRAQYAMTALR